LDENKEQTSDIRELRAGTDRLERNLGVANENIVCTLSSLGRISDRSVPPNRVIPEKREWFVVLDFNRSIYCVIRGQEQYSQDLISKHRRQYPNLRVVVQFTDHPNARELWNVIKRRLMTNRLIRLMSVTTFCLTEITEEEFVETVRTCESEKRKEHEEMWERVVYVDQDEEDTEVKEGMNHPLQQEETKTEVKSDEEEVQAVVLTVPQPQQEPAPQPRVTADTLLLLTIPELKALCRQNSWRGWSQLRKVPLVNFIINQSQTENQ